MFIKFLIVTLTFKVILAQISGEFWWLSDKFTQLKGVKIPSPVFEDISELETDETAKIIFKDDDLPTSNKSETNALSVENKNSTKVKKLKIEIHFTNDDKIVWPTDKKKLVNYDKTKTTEQKQLITKNKTAQTGEDIFKFYFPDNYNLVTKNDNIVTTTLTPVKETHNKIQNKDKMEINAITSDSSHYENICSYMTKNECYHHNGHVYKEVQSIYSTICCIVPLMKEESSRIIFPDSYLKDTRYKRATADLLDAKSKQRNFILKRKYSTPANPPTVQKQIQTKIVTSDEDYIDPYWNVKASNLKTPNMPKNPINSKNDCYQDYVEDYIVEVPKPGLIGLYSDHGRPSGWTNNDNKRPSYGGPVEDYDYNDEPPGYSTIDPRQSTTAPQRIRPIKFSSTSNEPYDPEKQIVSYESSPNFQVLQGFKLLNLAKNKNKYYSKNTRRTTTAESVFEEDNEESVSALGSESGSNDNGKQQLFEHCGETTHIPVVDNGKQINYAANGSHPWLALTVLTKRRQGILCYATIIHPRVAVTSADCVQDASDGEITIIAGLWDLNDRSQAQNRAVSIHIHPRYKPNDLAHNLAILYWNRPLGLNENVQPACLGEPQADDCKLFGWGGYDQAIRPRSRWQQAKILTSRQCNTRLPITKRSLLPAEAFCAFVQTRGTVTGVGGAVMCNIKGRSTAVGVAVSRDSVLVLLPMHKWTLQAVQSVLVN